MANNSKKKDQDEKSAFLTLFNRAQEAAAKVANEKNSKGATADPGFFRAIKKNQTERVLEYLKDGADLNAYNTSGQTALHIAALGDAVDVARLLIKCGAKPTRGKKSDPDYTPLTDAINFNKLEMVKFLTHHGGYVPGVSVDGWSLVHRACEKNKPEIVKVLLEAGAKADEVTENGSTPLLIAVRYGYVDLVKTLLSFPDVLVTMNDKFVRTDNKKRNAFQLALESSHIEMVSTMIDSGAHLNLRDAEGMSPLYTAISKGNVELVKRLVRAGADLNEVDEGYPTPLTYACHSPDLKDSIKAQIIDVLIKAGADADIPTPSRGTTPLHLLLGQDRKAYESLSVLLKYPINKEIKSFDGETPLMYAVNNSNIETVRKLLLEDLDINARHGEDGKTALIHSVLTGDAEKVRALVNARANLSMCDCFGKSALSYARSRKNVEIISVLERRLKEIGFGRKKKPKQQQSPKK